jgi:hypothetical protein
VLLRPVGHRQDHAIGADASRIAGLAMTSMAGPDTAIFTEAWRLLC